jgi:hypothetical protein
MSDLQIRLFAFSWLKDQIEKTGELLTWQTLSKGFREKVLKAYKNQCTICKLKHTHLLDAAHIIGYKEELGEPII